MTVDIEQALTPITQAQRMLAEAKTMPQLRELRDFATGAKAWARARAMGIEAENEAAEIILRAERKIGETLIAMRENGERQPHGGQRGQGLDILPSYDDLFPGVHKQYIAWWLKFAELDPATFDALIEAAKVDGSRLSSFRMANVIKQNEKREREPYAAEVATREDSAFLTFRAGAHALLGWQVDEQGIGHVTANGLRLLPDDELVQVATLIKRLAEAYNEAKAARG